MSDDLIAEFRRLRQAHSDLATRFSTEADPLNRQYLVDACCEIFEEAQRAYRQYWRSLAVPDSESMRAHPRETG